MNDLLQNLHYIRNLLQQMARLSDEEREIAKQGKAVIPLKEPLQKPKYSKAGMVIGLIFIALIVFYISGGLCARGVYRDRRTQYAVEEAKDEISWAMGHLGMDIQYPGYNVLQPEINDFVTIGILGGILIAIAVTVIIIMLIPCIRKRRDASIDARNVKIEEENKQITAQNQQIQEHNSRLSRELERIHGELIQYNQEYQRNADSWYPRDYATFEAIDFFINRVANHVANTMQDAVMLYEQERHKREMKELYIRQTDAIRKQVEIGNILQGVNAVINLSTNIATRQNLEVSRDTNAVAHQNLAATNAAYAETKRAADYLGQINSKIKR